MAALFPKTRRAVLGLLYSHPDESFYLREIAELTGLAVGQVQRELGVLTTTGVLVRFERGRHVYFQADPRCPIYDELRGIITKTMGVVDVLRTAFADLASTIDIAFIYGSIARSQENAASDLDLMVIGDVTFAEVSIAASTAEQRLRREVNPTVYPRQEVRSKYRHGHQFITLVMQGEKLFIIGDSCELGAILEEPVDSAPPDLR